jgi:hypothetical protein
VETFRTVFDRVKLKDEDLSTDEFKPGTSGQSALRKLFELQTRLDDKTIWQKQAATK